MKLLLCALSCSVCHNPPPTSMCFSPSKPAIGPQLGAEIQRPLEEALVLTLTSVTTLNNGMKHQRAAPCLSLSQ